MSNSPTGPVYFAQSLDREPNKRQSDVLAAMRAVLEDVQPAGVDPERTVARMEPHPLTPTDPTDPVLQLRIEHRADPEVWISIMVESEGTMWLASEPHGRDFEASFDNEYEPWESMGDLAEAQRFLRDMLEGRVESRLRYSGRRHISTLVYQFDADGRRRRIGAYFHVPNLLHLLLPMGRTEVYRPNYLSPDAPDLNSDTS